MDDKKPNLHARKEKKKKSLEDKVFDEARSDEMEEFYLKVRVDLEDAISGNRDQHH